MIAALVTKPDMTFANENTVTQAFDIPERSSNGKLP
jgi:hypothetical protein